MTVSGDHRPRVTMMRAGRILDRAGLSPGTTGNISNRSGDRVLTTATSSRLGHLTRSTLIIIRPDGTHRGRRPPTKELSMHLAVYAADPAAMAVVHLHSPHATAVSCLVDLDPDDAIPALTPYLSIKAGRVALVPYAAPGDRSIASEVARRVGAGYRALLLANHGSLVIARDIEEATSLAQELEEAARIMLMTRQLAVRTLDPTARAELDRMRTNRT
jgi:ribulose-5-phosphate 4-epimerase/fuculose-1-phosphate aldolase